MPTWGAPAHLDGRAYAQPLVYGSRVYVATENDTIYALDAATGAVVWQRSVGTAVPSGDLPCGDIGPTVGITSTPAIDPAAGRIFAVTDSVVNGAVEHSLVALQLADGNPVAGFPVPVDPPGADPKALLQRASLALDGGRVIIPYGGNAGDCSTYHGWLVSAAQDGSGVPSTFEVDPGPSEHGGAIWGSGDGPAIDPAGHVFVSTGNGFGSSSPDLQESVVELDPMLNQLSHWTADNWQALDNRDLDLGSSEPLPLPGGLLFEAGKDGVGRLLSAGALATTGQVFSAPVCSGGVFGASLYRSGVIYVPCAGGLAALALSTSPDPSFTALPGWSAPPEASGPPIFAGGLVWSTGWRSSLILYGLDPATGAVRYQLSVGAFNHFATPSAGGGRLFVSAGAEVYAVTIASFPPATTTTLSSSPNPSGAGSVVALTAAVSPFPDGGTVAFHEGGAALPGCDAVAPSPITGQATCPVRFSAGTHEIVAGYSGDAFFGASTSAALRQLARFGPPGSAKPPRITAVRLGARRFTARRGAKLKLTLSEAARLRVQISRLRTGRVVHRRCRLGPRKGRRCTIEHRARTLSLRGHKGRNRLALKLAGLSAGRYMASIVARDASRRSSKPTTVRFQIIPPPGPKHRRRG